MECLEYNK